MKKSSIGLVSFLRREKCWFCGEDIWVIKNLDPTGFVYLHEHVAAFGRLCQGSDLDVSERKAKRGEGKKRLKHNAGFR